MDTPEPLHPTDYLNSVRSLGFLSPAVAGSVAGIRARSAPIFELADEASRFGQGLMFHGIGRAARQEQLSPVALGTQLLVRTLSNFQGSVILAERGMTVEARTIVRSCYENAVLIGGLHVCPTETVDHMRADERESQIGRLTLLADEMAANGHDAAEIARVRERVA